ncbi:MAG TPA: hypothetical protein VLX90_20850 [Steroidobacteraceae bacterium]|nr:hypothetical protein [Steroidobacteraceae bacterium]
MAWVALAALAMSGATAGIATMSPPRVVIHAIWSHVAFGLSVVVVMLSSDGWSKPAVVVSPGSWTALRPAALVTPLAVLAQIAMGALYRHQILGVMPHMFGALAVALLTLVVSVILLQNFAEHRELKRVATILISIVLAQVCLGIAAFLMLLLNAGNVPAFAWLATAHVTTGSLIFGASMAAAMQVRRSIAPR